MTTGTACRQRHVNSAGVGRQYFTVIILVTKPCSRPVQRDTTLRHACRPRSQRLVRDHDFRSTRLSRRGVGKMSKTFAFSRRSTTVKFNVFCFVRFFYGYAMITLNMRRKPTAGRVEIRFKLTETDAVRTAPRTRRHVMNLIVTQRFTV